MLTLFETNWELFALIVGYIDLANDPQAYIVYFQCRVYGPAAPGVTRGLKSLQIRPQTSGKMLNIFLKVSSL